MQTFVTPPGVVRAVHIFRPLVTPVGSIWYCDISFSGGWDDIACNGPLAGMYRFVAVSAPTIYDGKGKAKALAGEIGGGSIIRVAGNHLTRYRRNVLTMQAVSIVDLVEPENVFSQMEFV
jgi:hypothetical protein